MALTKKELISYFSPIPPYLVKSNILLNYGTAGYRLHSSLLPPIVARCALIGYLRSTTFAGKAIGLMITASHNPEEQNGIKFIDHNDDMFDEAWEKISDEIVNCEDKDLYTSLNRLHRKYGNMRDLGDGPKAKIILGHDTRPSHEMLIESIYTSLEPFNVEITNYEFTTTPELHYVVRVSNLTSSVISKTSYLEHLISCFTELNEIITSHYPKQGLGKDNEVLFVDTSNGISKQKLAYLQEKIPLNIHFINNPGPLNYQCGADYIKSNCLPPSDINVPFSSIKKCVSFDGDADRVVFFYEQNNKIKILDGDHFSVMFLMYLNTLIASTDLTCGIILTQYSNTGLRNFLNERNYKVTIVNTGVKNLVKAARSYDIGIYFESNGHGSVVFSEKAKKVQPVTPNHRIFLILQKLFDPCVGDAISNFLIFYSIFKTEDIYKIHELYQEYPNRLLCVRVKNKSLLKLNDQSVVEEPRELKNRVDQLLVQKEVIRIFIRPSGTEDCIRVYVECKSIEECDTIALCVAQDVYDLCGGIGHHPEICYLSKKKD